jgi:hypothetical protein
MNTAQATSRPASGGHGHVQQYNVRCTRAAMHAQRMHMQTARGACSCALSYTAAVARALLSYPAVRDRASVAMQDSEFLPEEDDTNRFCDSSPSAGAALSCGAGNNGARAPVAGEPTGLQPEANNFYRRPHERRQGKAMVPSNISFQRSHVEFG